MRKNLATENAEDTEKNQNPGRKREQAKQDASTLMDSPYRISLASSLSSLWLAFSSCTSRSANGVRQQHGDRHGTHAARHRRDPAGAFLRGVESTSPTSLPSGSRLMPTSTTAAPGLIMSPVMSRGLPVATTRYPRAACDRKVACLRSADSNGGAALQEQQRHRLADDVAAADDDRFFALESDARMVQQRHAP